MVPLPGLEPFSFCGLKRRREVVVLPGLVRYAWVAFAPFKIRYSGDPSLRLKSGFGRDDAARWERRPWAITARKS